MKKTTVLLLLMTVASAYAQNLKTSIDGSLLNQGAKGINAMKLRNTLHLMTDSLKVKPTKQTLGLGNVDNTSDINKPISSATQIELDKKADIYSMQTALDTKSGLTSNNLFTGTNTFYTPVFANSTTPNLYSKLTGAWSSNSNIATFSLNYETRFGGNTISRTPLSIDYNGWVGIGVASPTTALDVSGAIKATSSITALNLNSYSTTLLATNVGGNVGIGLGSPSSKLHVAGTGRITGALILDNTVSGLLRADASGNITSDATAYLSSSTASSTYAPITSPTFTGNVTLPSTTSIGNVSDTELSYVDGATSNIQNQLNTKVNGSSYYNGNYGFLVSKKIFGVPAPPNFLPNIFWSNQFVDANDMDLQFALGINTKEPSIAQGTTSQYFRGDKTFQEVSTLPISSATQTALDLKANITSPTFITDATTPRLKITGAGDIGKGSDLVMAGNSNDLTMHGTGKVILGTGGFQRLVVTNAGNVGVGTTAPVAKFEVSGLAGFRYNDGKQADGKYLRSNSTGVAAWDSVKVSEVFGLNTTYLPINNPTATGILTAPSIVNTLGANFATTSGNVGIGTAAPNRRLEVGGTEAIVGLRVNTENLGVSANNYSQIELSDNSSVRSYWRSVRDGSGATLFSYNDNLRFLELGTERMRIINGGNVGIGTQTPSQKLHVVGNTSIIGNIGVGTSSPSYRLSVYNSTSGTSLDGIDISINDATAGVTHSTKLFTQQQGSGAGRTLLYAASNITGVTQGQLDILTENGGNFIAQLGTGYGGTNSLALYDLAGVVKNNINTNGNSFFNGGNVGIGTTAPLTKFHVKLTGTNNDGLYTPTIISTDGKTVGDGIGLAFYGHNSGNNEKNYGSLNYFITNPTAGAESSELTIRTLNGGSNGDRIKVSSSGNTLIGTTTDAGYKLDVNGNARFSNNVSIGTVNNARTLTVATTTNDVNLESINSRTTGNNYALTGNSNGIGAGLNMGGFFQASGATSNHGLRIYNVAATANNYSLYSDSPAQSYFQGSVGIGTTSPSYKLDVNGTFKTTSTTDLVVQGGSASIGASAGTNTVGLEIGTNRTGAGTSFIDLGGDATSLDYGIRMKRSGLISSIEHSGTGEFLINSINTGNILFATQNTERMRIFANGNIGIGTPTDAGYKLDVNGSLRTVNDTYLSTTAVSNVGIGTTTPSQKLDVDGNIKAFSVSGGGAYYSSTTATDAAARNWVMRGNSVVYGDFDIRQSNALNGDPIAAGNSRFYINPNGNVGIGTASPNASSVLDITSTTQGVLFPRLTTTQISAIASPADGLTVYNTTLKAICFYDSSAAVWKKVSHSNM